jgi:hypothetical protein
MNKRSSRLAQGLVAAGVTAASLVGAASAASAEPVPQAVTVDPALVEQFLEPPIADFAWPHRPIPCPSFPYGIVICDLPRTEPVLVPPPWPWPWILPWRDLFPKGIPALHERIDGLTAHEHIR